MHFLNLVLFHSFQWISLHFWYDIICCLYHQSQEGNTFLCCNGQNILYFSSTYITKECTILSFSYSTLIPPLSLVYNILYVCLGKWYLIGIFDRVGLKSGQGAYLQMSVCSTMIVLLQSEYKCHKLVIIGIPVCVFVCE